MIFSPFAFMAEAAAGGDPDANAFITAAGITDSTQQSAIQTLVTTMKTDGTWTKCDAIYPFVGGTATAHKYNLKDPQDTDAAYRLTFNGTITHNSDGMQTAGASTSYAETHWEVNTDASVNEHHAFRYITVPGTENCGYDGQGGSPYFIMGTCSELEWLSGASVASAGGTRTGGYAMGILRTASNNVHFYRYRNADQASGWNVRSTNTTSVGTISANAYTIGKVSTTSIANNDTNGFTTLGGTMTQAEFSDLFDAVQTFQTTLGRDV